MKLNAKNTLLVFIISTILALIARSSNIQWLTGLEPLAIAYLACLAIGSSWQLHLGFMSLSILTDLINLQPVGLGITSLYLAYLIVKLFNKIFNMVAEGGFFFNILVLILLILLKSVINMLFGQSAVLVWYKLLLGNFIVFALYYLSTRKIFNRNGFSR
jgi:hypothetical protein